MDSINLSLITPLREAKAFLYDWRKKDSSSLSRMNPLEVIARNGMSQKHGAVLSLVRFFG